MASRPFHVKAIYEYSSPHDDDLSFPVGQVINVTEEEGDDWYYGEYADQSGHKKEGLFPRNFVKSYEPETPPRPSRLSRTKKEIEGPGAYKEAELTSQSATPTAPPDEERKIPEEPLHDTAPSVAEPTKSTTRPSGVTQAQSAPKPEPAASSKPAPTATSNTADKSTSGSFRDRINAFNKPAAPPVAPTKPSGLGASRGSGFVKKAFVAPPPSKNAYVPIPREAPPQMVYNREEQLEAEAQVEPPGESEHTAQPIIQPSGEPAGDDDDQPKPTSLKERIALLQKQQMEQAARHAEAAQKKEKPKRPPKKRMESQELIADSESNIEGENIQRTDSGETAGKRSVDVPRVHIDPRSRSTARDQESPEATPIVSPAGVPRQIFSDGNEADVSGAADTEGEDLPTSRDEPDPGSRRLARRSFQKLSEVPKEEQEVDDEPNESGEADKEDEDVDPEVKKRMEIRERMAKMSGGMGMAGMFGSPGGMAPMPPRRQVPSASERKSSGNERSATGESISSRAPPVPMMPMPGLTKVRSPEQDITPAAEVSKEDQDAVPKSIIQGRASTDMPDVEDLQEEPVLPSRRSTDRPLPPPVPHERPVPPPPSKAREPPPPPPTERPMPLPPSEPRSGHPPLSAQPMSPSEGSESDDEMSVHARTQSLRMPTSDESRPVSREGPPPVPSVGPSNGPPPSLPSRPRAPLVQVPSDAQSVDFASKETSPTSPTTPSAAAKRSSRPPPIPGSSPAVPPPTPQNRAPPPPPPSAPPSRVATGEMRVPPPIPKAPAPALQDSDEEVTEYEGDYDTDIAPGASHKAALKSHSKEPAKDLNSVKDSDNDALHYSGLPSVGPAPAVPPRGVPPLPPTQVLKGPRQSAETPRGALPPPPPAKELHPSNNQDNEYDPYNYSVSSQHVTPSTDRGTFEASALSRAEDPEEMYSASPPRRNVPPSPAMSSSQYASPPSLSAPNRSAARQSLDVQRTSTSGRRSMEAPRASSDHGFIAGDIELDPGIQWWTQPNMPPPVLQNRRDVIYETEESTTTRRGGRQAVTRNVYVLYMDYSQTIIAAHFEARDPSEASLEQHHEPPPPRLRQDQLEDAHTKFGARIAEGANSKKDTLVGDGSPHALVLDLMASLPDALRPVGTRAYGALVYANLANASVQQFDEIRSGDIVTFRNAKFQGHRGPMHSKYSGDIGKPDHVAVVVDWDGTKKKVRAWEQGRESKKVKMESFKLGDMRSGEVKVWRVMARQWVGWE
ncbi:MAG: hypothetical protein Q9166_003023 [cf. Caloplaca sp. 2 TL-2023]